MMTIWLASLMDPLLSTHNWAFFTAAVIAAVVGTLTDWRILPKFGTLSSVLVDLVFNTAIIWLVPNVWHGHYMPFTTAAICGAVIAFIEIGVHSVVTRAWALTSRADR
jgi:hypothetical protein